MNRFSTWLGAVVVATGAAAPASAQAPAPTAASSPAVRTAAMLWQQVTTYITRAAEQMPESAYEFRPTPEVRTFGQLIGHIAGTQNLLCANALGEPGGGEDDVERSAHTKAALVAAIHASTEACRRAYAQSDAEVARPAAVFGQQATRFYALLVNVTHDNEHYGNIVTYMRLKGMVPPSSQPARQ